MKKLTLKSDKLDKFEMGLSINKLRSIEVMIFIGHLCLCFVGLEIPFVFRIGFSSISHEPITRPHKHNIQEDFQVHKAPSHPLKNWVSQKSNPHTQTRQLIESNNKIKFLSDLSFDAKTFEPNSEPRSLELQKMARLAYEVGRNLWKELQSGKLQIEAKNINHEKVSESCPHLILQFGLEFLRNGKVMLLPCALTLGSYITVIDKPRWAHAESVPNIVIVKDGKEVKAPSFWNRN